MRATIGIDTNDGLVQFELVGKIGYEPMSIMIGAPTNVGGGMRTVEALKVWESDTTFIIPFGHLAFLKLEK